MEARFQILLAEDDPDDQKIVKDALTAAIPNISLILVENGKEAIKYLENTTAMPDLLITDIQMPLMTGLEVLACIRNSAFPTLPVVILFTSKEADDMRKSKELGAILYISKPLMFKDWVTEMKRVGNLLS